MTLLRHVLLAPPMLALAVLSTCAPLCLSAWAERALLRLEEAW